MTANFAQSEMKTERPLNGADVHEFRLALLATGRDMGADAVIAIRRVVLDLIDSNEPLLHRAGTCWAQALEHALHLARTEDDAVAHARSLDVLYRRGLEAWLQFTTTPREVDENTSIVISCRLTCLALRRRTLSLHKRVMARAWSA